MGGTPPCFFWVILWKQIHLCGKIVHPLRAEGWQVEGNVPWPAHFSPNYLLACDAFSVPCFQYPEEDNISQGDFLCGCFALQVLN